MVKNKIKSGGIKQLLLFDELNKQKTIENTKNLLNNCRSFQNVLSDYFKYSKSQDYTFNVLFREIENEKQTHVSSKAVIVLHEVFSAINKLSNATSRRLIYEKYIAKHNDKDLYIATKMNLSEREFYRTLEVALLEFSEVYSFGELMIFKDEE